MLRSKHALGPTGNNIDFAEAKFKEQHHLVPPHESQRALLPRTEEKVGSKNGLSDLIVRVNHIALVVQDIGESLAFYTSVLGFHQIDRPNFDRHGAWLSMGNIQLHLIKGIPHTRRGQHPHDLIVSHIALDVRDTSSILQRIKQVQANFDGTFCWRQNISVPTQETSRKERFEKHETAEGKLSQFFLEDPDGYWIEICNCGEEENGPSPAVTTTTTTATTSKSVDGAGSLRFGIQTRGPTTMQLLSFAKFIVKSRKWAKLARQRLALLRSGTGPLLAELTSLQAIPAEAVDKTKLEHMCLRRNTYCDPCQGWSEEQILTALAQAGGKVPGALLLLRHAREATGCRIMLPPSFLDSNGQVHLTKPLHLASC